MSREYIDLSDCGDTRAPVVDMSNPSTYQRRLNYKLFNRSTGLLLHESGTFLLMALNAGDAPLDFALPGDAARCWAPLVDTEKGIADPGAEPVIDGAAVPLAARSLLLLEARGRAS